MTSPKLALALCLLAPGCSADHTSAPDAPPDAAAEIPAAVTFPATIVHEVQALPDARGVLLVGRQRTSLGVQGWIATYNVDGSVRWSDRVGVDFDWAETARVDPAGNVHVFGRSLDGEAWLLSYGPDGTRRNVAKFDQSERRRFYVDVDFVHVITEPSPSETGPSSPPTWLRLDWTSPHMASTRDELQDLSTLTTSEPPTPASALPAKMIDTPMLVELDGPDAVAVLQLRPTNERDAEVVIQVIPAPHRAAALRELEARVAPEFDAAGLDRQDWLWLWPLLDAEDLASNASYGAWLLAGHCSTRHVNVDGRLLDAYYPVPDHLAPQDACWKRAQLLSHLKVVDDAAFTANLDDWLALLPSTYDGRWDLESTGPRRLDLELRARILANAERSGHASFAVDALYWAGSAEADSDAFSLLAALPDSQAVGLARDLIERSRDAPARCEGVRELARHLVERRAAVPRWQADPNNRCDVLHVLCAGTQPELAARVVGSNGIRYTEHCEVSGSSAKGPRCNIHRGDTLEVTIDADTVLECGDVDYTYGTEDRMIVVFSRDPGGPRITDIHLSPIGD